MINIDSRIVQKASDCVITILTMAEVILSLSGTTSQINNVIMFISEKKKKFKDIGSIAVLKVEDVQQRCPAPSNRHSNLISCLN